MKEAHMSKNIAIPAQSAMVGRSEEIQADIERLHVLTRMTEGTLRDTEATRILNFIYGLENEIGRQLESASRAEPSVVEAATFLCDRLREYEGVATDGSNEADCQREWNGHVSPALARLEFVLTALPKAQAAPSVEYTREECGECGAQIMLVDGLEQCSCPCASSELEAISSAKMDTKHDHLNAEMNVPGRVVLSEEHFAEFERILEREPQNNPRLVKLLQGASSDTKDEDFNAGVEASAEIWDAEAVEQSKHQNGFGLMMRGIAERIRLLKRPSNGGKGEDWNGFISLKEARKETKK